MGKFSKNIYYFKGKTVYLPGLLNERKLEQMLKSDPPKIQNFDRDKLAYLLSLIHSIPCQNKALNIRNGFTPIYSKWLRDRIGNDYKMYIQYAIQANIIETDNCYIIGEKCKAYRFSAAFQSHGIIQYQITNSILKKKLANKSAYHQRSLKKYRHLVNFFNPDRLTIEPEAEDYLRSLADQLEPHKLNPHLIAVQKIKNGDFFYCVDTAAGRFHSNLTNLKKDLRQFLRYDGQELVNIDIVNSQPFLSLRLLDPGFWKKKDEGKLTIFDLFSPKDLCGKPKKEQSPSFSSFSTSKQFPSFMFQESSQLTDYQSVMRFKKLVLNGMFYEVFGDALSKEVNANFESRRAIKSEVFHILYGHNKEVFPSKRVFKEHYPDVARIFQAIKKRDYRLLPIILQRLESKIVLQKASTRIAKEAPDMPFFTIHDSIMTRANNVFFVQRILEDELQKATGHPAKTKIEKQEVETVIPDFVEHELLQYAI